MDKKMENLIKNLGLFEVATPEKVMFVLWFLSQHPETYEYAINGIVECNEIDGIEITKEGVTKELQGMIETWFEVPWFMVELWVDNMTQENKELWSARMCS